MRLAVAAAVLVAATLARAQVTLPPPAPAPVAPSGPTVQALDAEGQITRLDRPERTITLDTGAEYLLPPALDAAWPALADGVHVRLRYNVDGGRNIATAIQIGAR